VLLTVNAVWLIVPLLLSGCTYVASRFFRRPVVFVFLLVMLPLIPFFLVRTVVSSGGLAHYEQGYLGVVLSALSCYGPVIAGLVATGLLRRTKY